ncbi:MAG: hypothetical protein QGH34_03205 [Candidatus Woesearchaeota archaeon]|jgi:uncharacterized membrane protein|nr:hypothetical protein [Candidatus Woesearchaeota archaeon]|tara:strand:- start:2787 stop:2999 length:213 start_codon:yes stop_codon:yes gene_type:complete
MKKRLTEHQEFEIMKLVLDKFLWVGFILMLFGVYQMFAVSIPVGLMWFIAGIILLILFIILIVKEYEVIK